MNRYVYNDSYIRPILPYKICIGDAIELKHNGVNRVTGKIINIDEFGYKIKWDHQNYIDDFKYHKDFIKTYESV